MNPDISKNRLDLPQTVEQEFNMKAQRAVRAVVMGELEDAYTAFWAHPGGGHFGRLQDAMYAAQLIAQDYGKRFVVEDLVDVPVSQWLDKIKKFVDSRNAS